MSDAWLSRARIRRTAAIAALAPMLLPTDPGERVASAHRLIWSLFARSGNTEPRDFLWAEATDGVFYVLSARAPVMDHPLLEVDPPKAFSPALAAGDRLRFRLRANATKARSAATQDPTSGDGLPPLRQKTVHDDVVMRALHRIPSAARVAARREAVESEGFAWLARQGARSGFALAQDREGQPLASIESYQVWCPPRPRPAAQMRLGVLEFQGTLVVEDPERFGMALRRGFGRAKAFGCGLMLIARA